MPAQKKNLIRTYFRYNKADDVSECLVVLENETVSENPESDEDELRFGKPVMGTKVSNLRSYLKHKHKKIYQEFLKQEELKGKRVPSSQNKLTSFITRRSVSVQIKK